MSALVGDVNSDGDARLINQMWSSFLCENGPLKGCLFSQLNLARYDEAFQGLGLREKRQVLLGLIRLANAGSNVADLSLLGGSKNVGKIRPPRSKLLGDPEVDFYIIDQSVTGMFERKTRVGL